MYGFLWIGPIMRPHAAGLQARVHSPSWRNILLDTSGTMSSFPLNQHPQWIIKTTPDGLNDLEL